MVKIELCQGLVVIDQLEVRYTGDLVHWGIDGFQIFQIAQFQTKILVGQPYVLHD